MELDINFHDIYIINNGIVVNSTSKEDIGVDAYAFGGDYKELLLKTIESGDFIQERLNLVTTTNRFKSWSYQATKDKRYVIELESYSEIADEMMNMFSERLRNIIKDNKEVISANVWIPHEKWEFNRRFYSI